MSRYNNIFLKKQADGPVNEWVSPVVGTGVGALAGLGINEYLLKNKSFKSRLLSALTGGALGLATERLINSAGKATEKANKTSGDLTSEALGKKLEKFKIPNTPENRAAVARATSGKDVAGLILPAGGFFGGITIQEALRKLRMNQVADQIENLAKSPGALSASDVLQIRNGIESGLTPSAAELRALNIADRIDDLVAQRDDISKNTLRSIFGRGLTLKQRLRAGSYGATGLAAGIAGNVLADRYLTKDLAKNLNTSFDVAKQLIQ